jgi:TrkA domain protein
MAQVTETQLPGVGVRHDFVTREGDHVGVLSHRSGRRELLVYDHDDPDACAMVLHLDAEDTRTLGELLGASRVSEAVAAVQQQVEGLAIDWLTVGAGSPHAGTSIGDGQLRTRTGVSIVAVVRGGQTVPAPGPELTLQPGDVAVVVGTPEGITTAFELFQA